MQTRALANMPEPTRLPPETLTKLKAYQALLLKWNQKINLIGHSTEADCWRRHIEDSLQLLEHLPAHARTVTDLGSGAGLPGLILAIARPELEVNLVESDGRKCTFMKEAARSLGIGNAKIHHARIEVLKPVESEVITARAIAPLDVIFALGAPFAGPGCSWLLLKGKSVEKELVKAKEGWEFNHSVEKSRVKTTLEADQGYVLTLTQVRKRS